MGDESLVVPGQARHVLGEMRGEPAGDAGTNVGQRGRGRGHVTILLMTSCSSGPVSASRPAATSSWLPEATAMMTSARSSGARPGAERERS